MHSKRKHIADPIQLQSEYILKALIKMLIPKERGSKNPVVEIQIRSPNRNATAPGTVNASDKAWYFCARVMLDENPPETKIKRVIMDRATYAKCWGQGPVALEKKRLIKNGMLDEKGKPNEKTPPNWLKNYLEGNLKK